MRQLLDLLASAEPLGFDNIWLNEHHFTEWGGMLPSLDTLTAEHLIDQSRLIAGTPAEVTDMLAHLQRDVGFTQIDLMFQFGGLPIETARESMALFAAEVMPRLRSRQPAVAG
jgi:alkanesulfonate monooxygenase SsuD/methylene tetrahydromethanopterin reductase-like flavin-dependent oxidoreductase (luciferase family)